VCTTSNNNNNRTLIQLILPLKRTKKLDLFASFCLTPIVASLDAQKSNEVKLPKSTYIELYNCGK